MVEVRRVGLMELIMKVNTRKARKVDMEYLNGVIKVVMKVILVIIRLMGKEYTSGLMEEFMMESGKITK